MVQSMVNRVASPQAPALAALVAMVTARVLVVTETVMVLVQEVQVMEVDQAARVMALALAVLAMAPAMAQEPAPAPALVLDQGRVPARVAPGTAPVRGQARATVPAPAAVPVQAPAAARVPVTGRRVDLPGVRTQIQAELMDRTARNRAKNARQGTRP